MEKRKDEGQLCDRILPQGPVHLVTTFLVQGPGKAACGGADAAAYVPGPGTEPLARCSGGAEGAKVAWDRQKSERELRRDRRYRALLKHREWSDVVGDEPARVHLQVMFPWVDIAKVQNYSECRFRDALALRQVQRIFVLCDAGRRVPGGSL